MRPLVSSIVALAIAIAPFAAVASPDKSAHKPVATKVAKHHHKKSEKTSKAEKAEKAEKVARAEKADKADKVEKGEAPIVHVRHDSSKKTLLKPVLHHAHGVEVGGAGHREPKIEKGVSVIPASMVKPVVHGKLSQVSHKQPAEMPKLPNPNATKASSKSGAEKACSPRKPTEKKDDDSDDGKLWRDEEMADLVARIRGKHPSSTSGESDVKADAKSDAKSKSEDAKRDGKLRPATAKTPVCSKDPIEIIRGPEIDTFELTKCDGTLAPLAVEHLSVAVRPGGAARPTAPLVELAKKKGAEIAKGVHRVDDRLALRIQALADRFGKTGSAMKLSVVSGYRPASIGSMHATGRAIDFRIEGTKNEDVVAFCKTLTDTGCGYYPNSSFVHLDVREPGAGHVSWIDASGPGETPHYVSTWPLRAAAPVADKLEPASAKESVAKPDALETQDAPEAVDDHPAELPQ